MEAPNHRGPLWEHKGPGDVAHSTATETSTPRVRAPVWVQVRASLWQAAGHDSVLTPSPSVWELDGGPGSWRGQAQPAKLRFVEWASGRLMKTPTIYRVAGLNSQSGHSLVSRHSGREHAGSSRPALSSPATSQWCPPWLQSPATSSGAFIPWCNAGPGCGRAAHLTGLRLGLCTSSDHGSSHTDTFHSHTEQTER